MEGLHTLGLLFLVCFISAISANSDNPTGEQTDKTNECQSVADKFRDLKVGHADLVPDTKSHDDEMEICYKGSRDISKTSCCTRKMERKYHVAATKDFSDTVKQSSFYLKNMLQQRATQFQDQFLKLIQQAENDTVEIFNKDFSIPVQDRRGPLDNLFMDLTAYIKQREVDIHDTVSTFFNEIFPPVVQYLLIDASKLEMDDDYRDCLMGVRQSLIPRPFGDLPNNLAVDLTRSLGLARLYLEALTVGVEAINTTDHLPLDLQCSRAVTRLTYCAHCDGHVHVQPCQGYCRNVLRGCLASITQLDGGWNDYVDALQGLTSGVKSSLDIADVMSRLNAHISEAIMHAMHSSHKYYAKMIARCGQPKTLQGDTAALPSPPRAAPISPASSSSGSTAPKDQELYKQMESLMVSLSASKGFYHSLADAVCTAEHFSTGNNKPCWNGYVVGTYSEFVPEADFEHQMKNPEIKVSNVKPQALVSLADKLAHIKKKVLKKSSPSSAVDYDDGMQADSWNVDYASSGHGGGNTVDDEDYNLEYSGSGSGDWPGKNPPYKRDRGGAEKPRDDDIYLDENNKNSGAYIKPTPSHDAHAAAAPAVSYCYLLLLSSLLYIAATGRNDG